MAMPRIVRLQFLAIAMFCGAFAHAQAQPVLFVTIPPQRWLVSSLVDKSVRIEVMVPPGQNPHTFEPLGRQLALLSQSQGWFTIGMPFEKALVTKVRGSTPGLREFKSYRGIARLEDNHHHDHGEGGDSIDGDPHIWLDPVNMAQMATNVCNDLRKIWPDQSVILEQRLHDITTRIAKLQEELQADFGKFKGRSFWVYHPSWGYFGKRFGLVQRAVEESGREPSLRQMAALVTDANEDGAKVLFADPQFDPRPIERLARHISAKVVLIDPLAEDWEENLRLVSERVIGSFH